MWLQPPKVHFRLSTLVDHIFIQEHLKAILNQNVNCNIISLEQIFHAVYRILFFALGTVEEYCFLRGKVSRTSYKKKELYVYTFVYVCVC